MGILSKIIEQQKGEPRVINAPPPPVPSPEPSQPSNDLSIQELELLLKILGNADLKGREVEVFYHMILKIQSQYIAKQQR